METMTHLLLTAPITQRLWKQFASCAGFSIDGLHLHQLIFRWWEYEGSPKLQQIMKAIPTIVIWELWKRRNAKRHGKEVFFNKMYFHCQRTVHQLIIVKFPWIRDIPYHWEGMFDSLQGYKPKLYYQLVQWSMSEEGWIKCNTDGASKGNPGVSSYGFCIRNENGDLLYAEANRIGITTNMVTELTGIWQALRYCKAQGYDHIKLETDSLSLKSMIQKEWRIPWELNERIEEIHELMNTLHIHIKHIFREANQLADLIANTTIDQEEKQQFLNFNQLPSRAKKILNMDKQQIATIRIRTRRITRSP